MTTKRILWTNKTAPFSPKVLKDQWGRLTFTWIVPAKQPEPIQKTCPTCGHCATVTPPAIPARRDATTTVHSDIPAEVKPAFAPFFELFDVSKQTVEKYGYHSSRLANDDEVKDGEVFENEDEDSYAQD